MVPTALFAAPPIARGIEAESRRQVAAAAAPSMHCRCAAPLFLDAHFVFLLAIVALMPSDHFFNFFSRLLDSRRVQGGKVKNLTHLCAWETSTLQKIRTIH
jgi:hypothetical protein